MIIRSANYHIRIKYFFFNLPVCIGNVSYYFFCRLALYINLYNSMIKIKMNLQFCGKLVNCFNNFVHTAFGIPGTGFYICIIHEAIQGRGIFRQCT